MWIVLSLVPFLPLFSYSAPTQPPHSTRLSLPFHPAFWLQPRLQCLNSLGQIQGLEDVLSYKCALLSLWEGPPCLALSPDPCLLCQDIKHIGLVFQRFVLRAWATLFFIPWSPKNSFDWQQDPFIGLGTLEHY